MEENVRLIMTADPDWTHGDQLQLLRLLFGPRRYQPQPSVPADEKPDAVCSQLDGQQSPDKQ